MSVELTFWNRDVGGREENPMSEMLPARVPLLESTHDPSTSLGVTPGRLGMTAREVGIGMG